MWFGLVCILGIEPCKKKHTLICPHLFISVLYNGLCVALYIIGFTSNFAFLEEQQLHVNKSSFAARKKEGGVLSSTKNKNKNKNY